MKTTTLDRSYAILAHMMTGSAGVRLRFGSQACTDGNTVQVPLIREGSALSEAMLGYIAHEAGHVRYTTFGCKTQGIEGELLNALEDARIEKGICHLFRGAWHYIREMNVHMGFQDITVSGQPVQDVFQYMHLKSMKSMVPHCYDMVQCLPELRAATQEVYGRAFMIRLDALLDTLDEATSTQQVLTLVRKILEAFKDAQEASDSEDQHGTISEDPSVDDNDGGNESMESDPLGESSLSDATAPGTNDDREEGGQADIGMSTGKDQFGNFGSGPTMSTEQGNEVGNDQSSAVATEVTQRLMDAEGLYRDKGELFIEQSQDDIKQEMSTSQECLGASRLRMEELPVSLLATGPGLQPDHDVLSASSAVRQTMQRILEARSRSKRGLSHSGRRVKRGSMHRLGVHDTKVFASSAQSKRLNTAVCLLADMSGSMNIGNRSWTAKQAIQALALSIKPLPGIKLAIAGFGRQYYDVKGFAQAADASAVNSLHANGGTPMAEAMMRAATSMAKEKADRHVLVVLTDGKPDDVQATVYVRDLLQKSAVEILALGIETDSAKSLFDRSVTVNNVKELPAVLLSETSRLLGLDKA